MSYYFSRIRNVWYLQCLIWTEKSRHKQLIVGKNVRFNVPVRGGGEGTLIIGNRNSLGYRPAPRLGTGEILLQARHPDAIITIGEANAFNNNVSFLANGQITIGDRCQIGDLVCIYDCDFHEIDPATRNRSAGITKPVIIGNNVWLGSRVMVLKGVTIGDNSVIAAASVVTKSIPSNCIAAGNPAKVIRTI
ncbi:MAG: DapH/DapD/GlmU-related protein [Verrucomicrobiota bacterium]